MITATALKGDTLEIGFDDGSWLAVDQATDASPNTLPTGGMVEAVHRQENTLELRLPGGETVQIVTDPKRPMVTVVHAVPSRVGVPRRSECVTGNARTDSRSRQQIS